MSWGEEMDESVGECKREEGDNFSAALHKWVLPFV